MLPDPDVADDLEKLWRPTWLCLGRTAGLTGSGAQAGREVLGEGVLLVRQGSGRLDAFVNACRHRGHELVRCGETVRRGALWCAYHAWSYNLDGSLRKAPGLAFGESADPAGLGLLPVASHEWHGWTFVNPSGDAPPMTDPMARTSAPEIRDRAAGEPVESRTVVVDQPWRAVFDAFRGGSLPVAVPDEVLFATRWANLLIAGTADRLITCRITPKTAAQTRCDVEVLA